MDTHEIRNRTVATVLAALGAAATTATFLMMFQDSAETEYNLKLKAFSKHAQFENAPKEETPCGNGIHKIGDATILFPDFLGGLYKLGQKARAQPGGFAWFDNMGLPTLLVTNPEYVNLLLNKVTTHALWGGIKPASEAFFGKSVLFVLEGDEWKRLRYLLRDSFKMQKLDVLSKDVTSCAINLVNRLQEYADGGKTIDMNAALAQYHLASIGKSSFDYDMDVMQKFPKPNDVSASFEYLLQELPRRSFHPDAKVREDYTSATEDNIKWQKAAKTVRKVVTQAVVERLQAEKTPGGYMPRGDLLDSMITAYKDLAKGLNEGNDSNVQRRAEAMMEAIGDNLVEVFFAGFGTSVVGMCVALYHLAKNKRLMQQAQMEVDEVIPEDIEVGTGLNAKQFPFLCRVFKEALRVTTPSPLVARMTVEELEFGEFKIPAKTNVWIPGEYIHKDPQAWGSSVDVFDPSRWEKPIIPGSFVSFSGGSRDCIGKHFAELESVVAMAVLLKTYDFDVDSNFEFMPMFTGFGTRPGDQKSMTVSMNLIPKRRTDVSTFLYDWTPVRIPRRNSNPLLADFDDDGLPAPPKFD